MSLNAIALGVTTASTVVAGPFAASEPAVQASSSEAVIVASESAAPTAKQSSAGWEENLVRANPSPYYLEQGPATHDVVSAQA